MLCLFAEATIKQFLDIVFTPNEPI